MFISLLQTPPSANTQSSGADSGRGTITEEHIRASLLSAVEDKMRRSLREQSSRARDELDILRQTESELRAGKNRLDDILARLAKEQVSKILMISMLLMKILNIAYKCFFPFVLRKS